MAIYIKSAGLAFSAGLVSASVWEIGNSIYARVPVSRTAAPAVTTPGAASFVYYTPLVMVVVFAAVFALAVRGLRREAGRS